MILIIWYSVKGTEEGMPFFGVRLIKADTITGCKGQAGQGPGGHARDPQGRCGEGQCGHPSPEAPQAGRGMKSMLFFA